MKDDETVNALMLLSKSPPPRRRGGDMMNSDMIPYETKPKQHRHDKNAELVLRQVQESTMSLNRQKEKFYNKMINYTDRLYDEIEAEDASALNKLINSIDTPYFDSSIENAERKIITSKRYSREVTSVVNKMLFEIITFRKTVQLEVAQYNNMIGGVNSIKGLTHEQNTGLMAKAQLVTNQTANTLANTQKDFVGKMLDLLMILSGLAVSGSSGYVPYKIISNLSSSLGTAHDVVYTSIIGLGGFSMPMIENCLPDSQNWRGGIIKGECSKVADKSSYLYKFIESTVGSIGGGAAFLGETGAIVIGFSITIAMLLWFTAYTRRVGISIPFFSFSLGGKSTSTKRKVGRKYRKSVRKSKRSTRKSRRTARKSVRKSRRTVRKSKRSTRKSRRTVRKSKRSTRKSVRKSKRSVRKSRRTA